MDIWTKTYACYHAGPKCRCFDKVEVIRNFDLNAGLGDDELAKRAIVMVGSIPANLLVSRV